MQHQDEGLTISNPRLLSAIYFALMAIIATLAIELLLYLLGLPDLLPLFKATLLAAIVAAIFGAVFGEKIVHSKQPYRKHAFWWAFLMVLAALPLYDLGLFYLLKFYQISSSWYGIAEAYFWTMFYSYLLFGFWLAFFAGIAAVYLRSKIVYYLIHSLNVRPHPPA